MKGSGLFLLAALGIGAFVLASAASGEEKKGESECELDASLPEDQKTLFRSFLKSMTFESAKESAAKSGFDLKGWAEEALNELTPYPLAKKCLTKRFLELGIL
jgi:hypothetical protein